jgi:FMN reductase
MSNNVLVISTSLNPNSKSKILANTAFKVFNRSVKAELIDLVDDELPLCDGDKAYSHPNVAKLGKVIKESAAIILASPIYNYSTSAAAKNLIEMTGSAWEDKVVGFLCTAGGRSSYMSVMSLANNLMFDFRCVINPRFVYADGSAFSEGAVVDKEIEGRIEKLVESTIKLARLDVSASCH